MMQPHRFLYLSRSDVEALGMRMTEIIDAVTVALTEKAAGRTHMPAKHWIAPSGRRFFSAMSCALPRVGASGCKWQSGSPDNHTLGQPYITGQFILNALETGLPLAIMDSTWITEMRTAGATAVAAHALCTPSPTVFGVLGCGVQARRNLEALRLEFPSIAHVRAYDIRVDAVERFRADVERGYPVTVAACRSAREAFAGADIVLTCGPITPEGIGVAEATWLKKGATVITLDYDCYWKPGELARVDAVFTDDKAQLEHLKLEGYFATVPTSLHELAPVIAGADKGRTSANERIACINMGLALEDVATAVRLYRLARQRGVGIELPI